MKCGEETTLFLYFIIAYIILSIISNILLFHILFITISRV